MRTPAKVTIKRKTAGFSLMELVVVLAIIATLAGIAIPAYNNHIRRAKLTDGTAILADYRVTLEQYFQDNRNYGPSGGACGVAAPTGSNFTYTCNTVGAAPTEAYLVTATSVAGSGLGAAGDYVYTLNQQNVRATTKYAATSYTKSCWLISGSEC